MDPIAMARAAEDALADLRRSFASTALAEVQKMKTLLGEAKGSYGTDRTSLLKSSFYRIAHDLKGQGRTFGFSLITEIGAHTCQYITSHESFSGKELSILAKDISLLQEVLQKKLQDDDGVRENDIRDYLSRIK